MGTYTHLIWVGVVIGFIALMVRILNKKPQKPQHSAPATRNSVHPVIRFADAQVVVVDKPAGLTTMRHPGEAAEFGARGPVQTVSIACVSGLVAISQAAKIIQRGEADVMFVVGIDCLSEFVVAGFTAIGQETSESLRCPFQYARGAMINSTRTTTLATAPGQNNSPATPCGVLVLFS